MNSRNLVPLNYALAIAFFCLAMYSKITHSGDFKVMFIGCMLAQILFAVVSIYELRKSEQLTKSDKSTWSGLLLVAPILFGIIYLTTIRRKILYC